MSLNAKNKSSNTNKVEQDPLVAGTYPCRIVHIIGLGMQPQRAYQGVPKDPIDELMLTYESADEFTKDEEGNIEEDRPRWFSENFPFYGLYAENAKSTKRYKALDPDLSFDGNWPQLAGAPIGVVLSKTAGKGKHEGKFFNNVEGLSPLRSKEKEGMPELIGDVKVFDFYDPDVDVFMSFPQWIQDRIKGAVNYAGSDLEEAVANYKAPEEEKGNEEKSPNADATPEGDASTEPVQEDEEDNGEW